MDSDEQRRVAAVVQEIKNSIMDQRKMDGYDSLERSPLLNMLTFVDLQHPELLVTGVLQALSLEPKYQKARVHVTFPVNIRLDRPGKKTDSFIGPVWVHTVNCTKYFLATGYSGDAMHLWNDGYESYNPAECLGGYVVYSVTEGNILRGKKKNSFVLCGHSSEPLLYIKREIAHGELSDLFDDIEHDIAEEDTELETSHRKVLEEKDVKKSSHGEHREFYPTCHTPTELTMKIQEETARRILAAILMEYCRIEAQYGKVQKEFHF